MARVYSFRSLGLMTLWPKSDDPWGELRRRERLVIFAFAGFLPIGGGLAFFASHFTHAEPAILSGPLLWMLFIAYSWLRFMHWPCPARGRPFHMKW
jgi:hypothetical protein